MFILWETKHESLLVLEGALSNSANEFTFDQMILKTGGSFRDMRPSNHNVGRNVDQLRVLDSTHEVLVSWPNLHPDCRGVV